MPETFFVSLRTPWSGFETNTLFPFHWGRSCLEPRFRSFGPLLQHSSLSSRPSSPQLDLRAYQVQLGRWSRSKPCPPLPSKVIALILVLALFLAFSLAWLLPYPGSCPQHRQALALTLNGPWARPCQASVILTNPDSACPGTGIMLIA